MYPHTKFGIPTSKNIGDMDRTRKRDGRTDGRTDGLTDWRTVRLLYASQSSFGGIIREPFHVEVFCILKVKIYGIQVNEYRVWPSYMHHFQYAQQDWCCACVAARGGHIQYWLGLHEIQGFPYFGFCVYYRLVSSWPSQKPQRQVFSRRCSLMFGPIDELYSVHEYFCQ